MNVWRGYPYYLQQRMGTSCCGCFCCPKQFVTRDQDQNRLARKSKFQRPQVINDFPIWYKHCLPQVSLKILVIATCLKILTCLNCSVFPSFYLFQGTELFCVLLWVFLGAGYLIKDILELIMSPDRLFWIIFWKLGFANLR